MGKIRNYFKSKRKLELQLKYERMNSNNLRDQVSKYVRLNFELLNKNDELEKKVKELGEELQGDGKIQIYNYRSNM